MNEKLKYFSYKQYMCFSYAQDARKHLAYNANVMICENDATSFEKKAVRLFLKKQKRSYTLSARF